MKFIFVSKIGSVTKNIPLSHEIQYQEGIIPAKSGVVLVTEVMEDQRTYNELELVSGRLSKLHKGDKIVVALGNRRALRGFVGNVPKNLKSGDIIHRLSLSGVSGICSSANMTEVGKPLPLKVIGAVVINNDVANVDQFRLFDPINTLKENIAPLILVTGTCMHVGKTTAAAEIIKQASRSGKRVASAKITGVAAMKDLEEMRDYGSIKAVSFLDAGATSSIDQSESMLHIFKGALNYLQTFNPEIIVVEFGDGIMGEYGVMELISDKDIQKNTMAHIGCAYDPVGAVKLAEVSSNIGLPLNAISGPVTDNLVGQNFIRETVKIPAINAIYQGQDLLFHCRV